MAFERFKRLRSGAGEKFAIARANIEARRQEREREREEKEAREMARLEKESAKMEMRARLESAKASRIMAIQTSRATIAESRRLQREERYRPIKRVYEGLKKVSTRMDENQARNSGLFAAPVASKNALFGLNSNAPNLLTDRKKRKEARLF